MNRDEINKLARKLERAKDVSDLYERRSGPCIADDLARLARSDLYGAYRLWDQFATPELKAQPGATPTILYVARITEQHFEGRSRVERNDVVLHHERDCVVGRPMDQETYRGNIVGETPDYLVQKEERGDFILHSKANLTYSEAAGSNVSIRYPFSAIGGVGLVSANTPSYTLNAGPEHERQISSQPEFS